MARTLKLSTDELAAARFRAHPAYEIVVFDRLPESHRRELASLADDPDGYGVLWPKAPGLAVKAVDRETALLCYTLGGEPGRLPAYVRQVLGAAFAETIVQLVLEDVLEIEIDGELLSGAAAHAHLVEERARDAGTGRIAELSRSALRHAARLDTDGPRQLALWLYQFNAVPASPAWRRRLPDEEAALRFVGLGEGTAARRALDGQWSEAPPADENRGWRFWRRRAGGADRGRARAGSGYKLYVSPRPDGLETTVPAVVEGLGSSAAGAFKIGRDLPGLLRPDKIVAYFADFESLAAAAEILRREVRETAAQGVPFTAAIDDDGLFSWGMDPPAAARGGADEPESWRLWVVNRLAVALLAARAADGGIEPWRFALERLEGEGVNTATWAPKQTMWEAAGR